MKEWERKWQPTWPNLVWHASTSTHEKTIWFHLYSILCMNLSFGFTGYTNKMAECAQTVYMTYAFSTLNTITQRKDGCGKVLYPPNCFEDLTVCLHSVNSGTNNWSILSLHYPTCLCINSTHKMLHTKTILLLVWESMWIATPVAFTGEVHGTAPQSWETWVTVPDREHRVIGSSKNE